MLQSLIGHTLSAAGVIECIATLIQMDEGFYHPTCNLDNPLDTNLNWVDDADLSLLSYLDCAEKAYQEYEKRVEGVDYQDSFDFLLFHTPFGGMVKGGA